MVSKNDFDVDKIIEKLLEVKGCKTGKNVNLSENDIKNLCNKAREIFISQPILLELEAPIKVCGKFHDFLSSNQVMSMANTTIYSTFSSVAASLQRLTIYFWVTTSIEANRAWKPSACS